VQRAGFELVRADEHEVVPRGRFDIVPRDYYSPIPDLARLPGSVWDRRSELGGIKLDALQAVEHPERELAPFIAELDFTASGGALEGFALRNDAFESVDAELLYAVIRSLRPSQVIELGSGYSSLLINAACRRNAAEGVACEHEAFDPFPRRELFGDGPPAPTRLTPVSANDVPLARFEALAAGDVLFVDTTHTVKLGSDVNFIILDVLPRLRSGS
jgi:hypothetical protein